MKNSDKKLNLGFAIALTVVVNSLASVQPASAQLLELATGALSIFNSVTGHSAPQSSPPPVVVPQQPISDQTPNLTLGTGNFNGNNINLCVSSCFPHAAQPIPPAPGNVPTFPAGTAVSPVTPVPQTVQPAPNRPVLTIPPISLPTNF